MAVAAKRVCAAAAYLPMTILVPRGPEMTAAWEGGLLMLYVHMQEKKQASDQQTQMRISRFVCCWSEFSRFNRSRRNCEGHSCERSYMSTKRKQVGVLVVAHKPCERSVAPPLSFRLQAKYAADECGIAVNRL
jgi:hypothetical protein